MPHHGLRITISSCLGVILLIVAGFWTHHAVMESLLEIQTENLRTILEADVAGLKVWMDNQMSDTRSLANIPQVRQYTQQLVTIGREPSNVRDKILASDAHRELVQVIKSEDLLEERFGFTVVDRSGLLIADNESEYVGQRLSPRGMATAARIFDDQGAVIANPYHKGSLVSGQEIPVNRSFLLVAAPIRDKNGEIIASLVFGIDPEKDFTRILSLARLGESGDTYAFDESGVMISDSRFDDQLKAMGLLPDTPTSRPMMNVQLRDPGGNLTRGFKPDRPLSAMPLTKMIASAVTGESGVDLRGSRDFRGVRVIGAWMWLPAYHFGVAIQVDRAEALKVLRPLWIAFSTLFGLLIVAIAAILIKTYINLRLRNRIDEVKQLGRYTLIEKIGEGGMGKVYKAQHAMHLIHRDIKPSNIILCERGGQADVAKVLDFGLVKDVSAMGVYDVTAPQVMPGTPAYIAPERLKDPSINDTRSDLYAIGAVGFNLLTGRDVFIGASAMAVCNQAISVDAPRPSDVVKAQIPTKLEQIICDCLERDPTKRPPDVVSVMTRLEAVDLEPWTQDQARRWWAYNRHRISGNAESKLAPVSPYGTHDSTVALDVGH